MFLLVAVNAKYQHTAYGIRSIAGNLPPEAQAELLEADQSVTPFQLAETILAKKPAVAAFSTYLWNGELLRKTARILREIAPDIPLIFGGPEITPETVALFDAVADILIIGEGEEIFQTLSRKPPEALRHTPTCVLTPPPVDTAALKIPTHLYTEADCRQKRTLYIESSRGCPYRCAYCTSAATALRLLPLTTLLPAIDDYLEKGVRSFKFLDRSFNAIPTHACAIIDHFLKHPDASAITLHFEVHPVHLPKALKDALRRCPPGMLHLEAGIQTLNPEVSQRIGRGSEIEAALENLRFLTRETGADVHADLIFGLPGEDEASFAEGFNRLVTTCTPPELQVNLLKGLPGTRLMRMASEWGLHFNPAPPYELIASREMDFETLCRIQRFARIWELVYNRGRFPRASRLILDQSLPAYTAYASLADQIHRTEGRLHALGLTTLRNHLERALIDLGVSQSTVSEALHADMNAKPL